MESLCSAEIFHCDMLPRRTVDRVASFEALNVEMLL
jgi:hypothetical protein